MDTDFNNKSQTLWRLSELATSFEILQRFRKLFQLNEDVTRVPSFVMNVGLLFESLGLLVNIPTR